MSTRNRIGNKWTVNEVLSLQREFELLGWDIDQIAEKHGRTANAIMYKLDQEGFADYNVLHSIYHTLNDKNCDNRVQKLMALGTNLSDDDTVHDDEQEEDQEEDPLTERVSKMESGLNEIKHMLTMVISSVHGLSQVTYGSNQVPKGCDF